MVLQQKRKLDPIREALSKSVQSAAKRTVEAGILLGSISSTIDFQNSSPHVSDLPARQHQAFSTFCKYLVAAARTHFELYTRSIPAKPFKPQIS